MSKPELVASEIAPSPKVLRSRRIQLDDFAPGKVYATVEHGRLSVDQAQVANISIFGLGVILPAVSMDGQDSLFRVGDVLRSIKVFYEDSCIYDGRAVVLHVEAQNSGIRLGLSTGDRHIDLPVLYRKSTSQGFLERWQQAFTDSERDDFPTYAKEAVLGLAAYMRECKAFLDQEEALLKVEDDYTRRQTLEDYLQQIKPQVLQRLYEFSNRITQCLELVPVEEHPTFRAFCQKHLLDLYLESPMARRSYEKPLGYAGDYEVMNMLYRDHAEGDSLFAKILNVYLTESDAAMANSNRLTYLGEWIRTILGERNGKGTVSLASVGCGPAREIVTLLKEYPELGKRLEVTLIDQDERAIRFCEKTLSHWIEKTGIKMRFVRESISRILVAKRLPERLGRFDFIYSAGLFDYLNDKNFSSLSQVLYDALLPKGLMAIGNVAKGNPSQGIMEFVLEWFLLHRSKEDLVSLVSGLEPKAARVEVGAEPLGLNLFLLVRR